MHSCYSLFEQLPTFLHDIREGREKVVQQLFNRRSRARAPVLGNIRPLEVSSPEQNTELLLAPGNNKSKLSQHFLYNTFFYLFFLYIWLPRCSASSLNIHSRFILDLHYINLFFQFDNVREKLPAFIRFYSVNGCW